MSDIDYETIECTIPSNVEPGVPMHVQTEDGRMFTVIVPSGYRTGDHLTVTIPRNAEGGSMTTAPSIPTSTTSTTVSTTSDTETTVGQPMTYTSNERSIGAAAVGAVIGTILLGPVVGVVVAGAAVYASTRDDRVGEAARSVGGVAYSAINATTELAEKYHVKEKLAAAGTATANKLSEINQEYKVTDKVKEAGSSVAKQAAELDTKYGISNKASNLFAQGVSAGFRAAASASSSSSASARK